jgi:hypothetical protein
MKYRDLHPVLISPLLREFSKAGPSFILRPFDPSTLRPFDPSALRPFDPSTFRPATSTCNLRPATLHIILRPLRPSTCDDLRPAISTLTPFPLYLSARRPPRTSALATPCAVVTNTSSGAHREGLFLTLTGPIISISLLAISKQNCAHADTSSLSNFDTRH